jgi:hypothetical protein
MGLSFLKEVFDWDLFFYLVRRISTIAGRLFGLGWYPFAELWDNIIRKKMFESLAHPSDFKIAFFTQKWKI